MNVVQQASSPQTIRELAAACSRYVKQALSLELDNSPDTLPILDHYLDDCRKLLLDNHSDAKIDDILTLVVPAAGAYFGEVVRQAYPQTTWQAPGEAYPDYRLIFDQFSLAFNPIGCVLEAVHRSQQPGWDAHFQLQDNDIEVVKQALDTAGAVRSDDFYRLTIRFEVLEQIAQRLMSTPSKGQQSVQV